VLHGASVDHSKRVYDDEQICLRSVQICAHISHRIEKSRARGKCIKRVQIERPNKAMDTPTKPQATLQFYRHEFKIEEPHKKGESTNHRCKCSDSHPMANEANENISPDMHTPQKDWKSNSSRPTNSKQRTHTKYTHTR